MLEWRARASGLFVFAERSRPRIVPESTCDETDPVGGDVGRLSAKNANG